MLYKAFRIWYDMLICTQRYILNIETSLPLSNIAVYYFDDICGYVFLCICCIRLHIRSVMNQLPPHPGFPQFQTMSGYNQHIPYYLPHNAHQQGNGHGYMPNPYQVGCQAQYFIYIHRCVANPGREGRSRDNSWLQFNRLLNKGTAYPTHNHKA